MYIVTNSTATHLLFKHNARKTLSTYKYILLKLSTEAWDTQHYYPATDHLNDRKPALHCKPRQRGTARTAIHPRLLRDKQLLNCQIMTENLFNNPPDHNLVQERLTAKILYNMTFWPKSLNNHCSVQLVTVLQQQLSMKSKLYGTCLLPTIMAYLAFFI